MVPKQINGTTEWVFHDVIETEGMYKVVAPMTDPLPITEPPSQ